MAPRSNVQKNRSHEHDPSLATIEPYCMVPKYHASQYQTRQNEIRLSTFDRRLAGSRQALHLGRQVGIFPAFHADFICDDRKYTAID
jgi:hypothetical protein